MAKVCKYLLIFFRKNLTLSFGPIILLGIKIWKSFIYATYWCFKIIDFLAEWCLKGFFFLNSLISINILYACDKLPPPPVVSKAYPSVLNKFEFNLQYLNSIYTTWRCYQTSYIFSGQLVFEIIFKKKIILCNSYVKFGPSPFVAKP